MRDKFMLGGGGFLGAYYSILKTCNTQNMWWGLDLQGIQLTGPFWLSDMENFENHHDEFTGNTKPCKLNKNDLIDRLHSSGETAKGRKDDIISKEKENYILVEENEHKKKDG